MGDVINLRIRRKQKSRDAARKSGDENAARFGVTKFERRVTQAEAEKAARHLDQHHIPGDPPEPA